MTGKEARAHAEAAIQRFRLLGKKAPLVDPDEIERRADEAAAAKHARENAPLTRKDFNDMIEAVKYLSHQVQDLEETVSYHARAWRAGGGSKL